MSDEDRIRAYMHDRADVAVPDDLRWPSVAGAPRRRRTMAWMTSWGRLAAAAIVACVVLVGVFSRLPMGTGPAGPSTPANGSAAPATQAAQGPFPSTVAGLPVVTVARAADLLRSGKLDGRAVAVAGYYQEVDPSCPYPGRYIGPLESWCRATVLSDTVAGAQLCTSEGNSTSCHGPTGTYLAPFFMNETSGSVGTWLPDGATGKPVALVVIGHGGDARQWQCTAATQSECGSAFVVDRIAWAAGQDVPLTAPQTGDQQTGKLVTPKLTVAQAVADAGVGENAVTAAAFRAGDIATIDPRWNFAGSDLVWIVRSLGQAGSSQDAETRLETVTLVDDATGKPIDSHPQPVSGDYRPARLWQMATAHGLDCCAGDEFAFYRVDAADGTAVFEGMVGGGESGGSDSTTTFGGSYGSGPLVLPAGSYSITIWLASYDQGAMGTPRDQCSTQITLGPLDNVSLNADFPVGKACTLGPAPSPSVISP